MSRERCMCSCSPCIQGSCSACTQANGWCSDAVQAEREHEAQSKRARLATAIVGDIERDTDCRSLFDGVDSDVRDEILHGWREIVLKRLKEAT